MFKIAAEPTFRHEVSAKVPVDGGFETQKFKATFRVIAPEEIDGYDLAETKASSDFLRRVVVRLDEIAAADGEPIEWNDAALEAVLRLPWARAALARGYFSAIAGAATGN